MKLSSLKLQRCRECCISYLSLFFFLSTNTTAAIIPATAIAIPTVIRTIFIGSERTPTSCLPISMTPFPRSVITLPTSEAMSHKRSNGSVEILQSCHSVLHPHEAQVWDALKRGKAGAFCCTVVAGHTYVRVPEEEAGRSSGQSKSVSPVALHLVQHA